MSIGEADGAWRIRLLQWIFAGVVAVVVLAVISIGFLVLIWVLGQPH
jgi:hypothetical protein